jgi:hypothetical protein
MLNKWLQFVLDFFKPAIDGGIAELKANRDVNIASIEKTIGATETTATEAVVSFIQAHIVGKGLAFITSFVVPELTSLLGGLVANGNAKVPELYDAAVAFLEKEDAYL